jgi:hypothetical protein
MVRRLSNSIDSFISLAKKAAVSSHRALWEIWDDFIYLVAAELSQPLDPRQEREDEYIRRGKGYNANDVQLFPMMFGALVNTMQRGCSDTFWDILGEAYMQLELNNHWKGQYFTPYGVCKCMAMMTIGNVTGAIEERGYVSISDPSCGAGGLLIAAADVLRGLEVDFQKAALFVGQDIDSTTALMCYIQMSLLGMPGIVYIGNSLTMEIRDVWYTPFYILHWWKYCKRVEPSEEKEITPGHESAAVVLQQLRLNETTGQYSLF